MANSDQLEEYSQAIQGAAVNASIDAVAIALKPNDIMECTECGEIIEPERKAAMPSAIHCIECMHYFDKANSHKSRFAVRPTVKDMPDFGGC